MIVPIGDKGFYHRAFNDKQWFVDSKKLCKDVKKVIKNNELNFFPSSWMNTLNIDKAITRCISRQLGHRIPVYIQIKIQKLQ